MTVAARPQRPIPTVQASPALLQEGDMIYPDLDQPSPHPFRVSHKPDHDDLGWIMFLDGGCLLYVPDGHKVRTQRRPNPSPPTPAAAWDALEGTYREPRYV